MARKYRRGPANALCACANVRRTRGDRKGSKGVIELNRAVLHDRIRIKLRGNGQEEVVLVFEVNLPGRW